MTDSSPPKKRKRDTNQEQDVTLSMSSASGVGPVIVTFPGLQPAPSTPFKCYVKRRKSSSGQTVAQDLASKGAIIAGETESVEFHTGNADQHPNNPSCQYLVGVRDKTTNKIKLRHAPLHVLVRDVKALKSLDSLAISMTADERFKARNALGEAFGSKKARQAIRAMERNRVDVSAMEGVASHLQDSIDVGTGNLPSIEQAKASADESRLIPRYNVHAKSPDEVYALHDIITEGELSSISVAQILSAPDERSRIRCLPYQRSEWVNRHLAAECAATKPNKTNLKILFFISSLILFRTVSVVDKAQLQKKMSLVPSEIIDGLLARFSERGRNSTKAQTTNQTQTLLLTHMFALCLRLDGYATEPTLIAGDLSISTAAAKSYFKQLGCKIEVMNATERAKLGLGPPLENEPKRCILRVPLDFPKERVHKRK